MEVNRRDNCNGLNPGVEYAELQGKDDGANKNRFSRPNVLVQPSSRGMGSGTLIITIYQRLSARGADNREHNGVA